jgi:hypothetical protein
MKNLKSLLVLCLASCLGSCVLLPRQKLEAFTYGDFTKSAILSLGNVEVDHATMQERIAKMLPEAITLAAKKNGLAFSAEQAQASMIMDLWVSEKNFNRDLETLNSISFSATLRDRESGKTVIKIIYTEETADTLVSFYHLYDVADAVCKSIFEKLPAQAKSGT